MAHVRGDTNLTVALLCLGSFFYQEAWDTYLGREHDPVGEESPCLQRYPFLWSDDWHFQEWFLTVVACG